MKIFIIKYRLVIVLVAILITLLSLVVFPRLKINANVDDYVPDSVTNKIHLKKLDSIFGGSEMILVMLQTDDVVNYNTLNRLRTLATALRELEGIDRSISPFDAQEITIEDGFMATAPFLSSMEEGSFSPEATKASVRSNRMAGSFFSEDYSLVSIVLTKNTKTPDTIIDAIKGVVQSTPGDEEVLIGGLPFIRHSIAGNIQKDLVLLLPIAMLLMIGMLFFSFREWKGVFMPFIIVVMSIILAFGVMAAFGWEISLFSILMPIMIIAIANDYGIHLIARYQELARSEADLSMKEICKHIYGDLYKPILITGLTTIGGVLGLLTHTMIPAAQLGVLTAIGIGFALLLSIWFLPALLSYFKVKNRKNATNQIKKTPLDKSLIRIGKWITGYPKRIVLGSVLITLIGIIGVLFIKVDTNVESYFSKKSEVGRSTALINEKFGGSQFISVLFSGEVLSPEVLRAMEAYENEIRKNPAVGLVNSPVTLVKELSKGFYTKQEEGYNQIPESIDEVYQLMEVFALGENEDAISQFLDYDYENARMLISMKGDPNVQFVAGAGLTEIELADIVVKGQMKSLIFAMVVIFILLSIVFRSAKAGLLSSLPLTVAIVLLFGLMGIFGIAIDIATALLSSIMIGVGVDYTIHLLWRFKEERGRGLEYHEAMKTTIYTSGRGIVINAISVIVGFLPLTLSGFTPLKFFGALIVISIGACLVCSLLSMSFICVDSILSRRKSYF